MELFSPENMNCHGSPFFIILRNVIPEIFLFIHCSVFTNISSLLWIIFIFGVSDNINFMHPSPFTRMISDWIDQFVSFPHIDKLSSPSVTEIFSMSGIICSGKSSNNSSGVSSKTGPNMIAAFLNSWGRLRPARILCTSFPSLRGSRPLPRQIFFPAARTYRDADSLPVQAR